MICYAVIDTNVLVSALLTSHEDAATVRVVDKIFSGQVIPVFSEEIMAEYKEVLRRSRFHFDQETVRAMLDAIAELGEQLEPSPSGAVLPDMKDLPFYEVVLEKRATEDAWLVTGNLIHFPREPFIVTAAEFIQLFQ